jgi:hypothetical protein
VIPPSPGTHVEFHVFEVEDGVQTGTVLAEILLGEVDARVAHFRDGHDVE